MDQDHLRFRNIIEQLEHAVTNWRGKTTITAEDIRIMKFMDQRLTRAAKMGY